MIQQPTIARLQPPINDRDHILGPRNASVTLTEYGDYECPYCALANVSVHQVLEALGDDLLFAFRNFPLREIHPHAWRAAQAAEAAGEQGRFWEMHDLLYANQDRLEDADLLRYAANLVLDTERFARELNDGKHAARVREDYLSGVRSGVNGTPAFFIDGVRYEGPWDAPNLLLALGMAGK